MIGARAGSHCWFFASKNKHNFYLCFLFCLFEKIKKCLLLQKYENPQRRCTNLFITKERIRGPFKKMQIIRFIVVLIFTVTEKQSSCLFFTTTMVFLIIMRITHFVKNHFVNIHKVDQK